MIPTLSIRQTMSNLSGIRKAMKALTRQDVLIGVPALRLTGDYLGGRKATG